MARLRRRRAAQSDSSRRRGGGDDTESDHSHEGADSEPDAPAGFDSETEYTTLRLFTDALSAHVDLTKHTYAILDSIPCATHNTRHSVPIPAAMGPYKRCVVGCYCGDRFRFRVCSLRGGAGWGIRISKRIVKPCYGKVSISGRCSRDIVAFFQSFIKPSAADEDQEQQEDEQENEADDQEYEEDEEDHHRADGQEDEAEEEDAEVDEDDQEEAAEDAGENQDDDFENSDLEDDVQEEDRPDQGFEQEDEVASSSGSGGSSPARWNQRQLSRAGGASAGRRDRDHVDSASEDGSGILGDDDAYSTPDRRRKRQGLPKTSGQARGEAGGKTAHQYGNVVFSPGILRTIVEGLAPGEGITPAQVYISGGRRRGPSGR